MFHRIFIGRYKIENEMKHLRIFETEAEFKSEKSNIDKPWVSMTNDDELVYIYVDPSLNITMDDEYDDKALIPLKAKKQGIDEDIVWSHNLASDVATIDGTTLRFTKHYEGSVKVTATAGELTDEKAIIIKCVAVPDQVTYTVVTPPSVKTVNWDDTTADLSFVGKIVATYSDGHKPSETTQSTYNFTAEFPQNPHIYPEINTEMVDLGLPSGTKWAKCNLYGQTETDYGYYFQWADTNGYPTAGESTIDREGTYDWEGHDIAWTVKQKNQLSKFFDFNTTPYQTNESAGTYAPKTKFTKYLGSTESTYKDESATDEDALKTVLDPMDDAIIAHMGEGWSMPTASQFSELLSGTTNEWVEDYNGSGINGRLFTSKTNGNTLFIPAAGYGDCSSMLNVSSYCDMWSRNLNASSPFYGFNLYFNSGNCYVSNYNRFNGFSVRGVHA